MLKPLETILSIDVDWVSDPRTFKDLLKTVSPIIKNTSFDKIVFSQCHKDIKHIIDDIKEPVYVVNIDHHHDIQYHDTDPLYRGFLSGNWLGHYLINKKVSGATWIANYNSLTNAFQNFKDPNSILIDDVIRIVYNLEEVNKHTYKYLFVCQSPHHSINNMSAFCAYEALLVLARLLDKEITVLS